VTIAILSTGLIGPHGRLNLDLILGPLQVATVLSFATKTLSIRPAILLARTPALAPGVGTRPRDRSTPSSAHQAGRFETLQLRESSNTAAPCAALPLTVFFRELPYPRAQEPTIGPAATPPAHHGGARRSFSMTALIDRVAFADPNASESA